MIEQFILTLTKRFGSPTCDEQEEGETFTWQLPLFLIIIIIDDDDTKETISIQHNNHSHVISISDLEHLLEMQQQWNTRFSKPYDIQLLEKCTKCKAEHSKHYLGSWSIDTDIIHLYNNPLELTTIPGTNSSTEFVLVLNETPSEYQQHVPIENVIHILNEHKMLVFDWSAEEENTPTCSIYKLPTLDITQELQTTNLSIDINELLLPQLGDPTDKWAMIVRDTGFHTWKCFIGIPKHNQSILYEQAHTELQFTDSVAQLSLGKLTFSGFMKQQIQQNNQLEHFVSQEEYNVFNGIDPDDIWWFGFDFNHSPIAHYQVFEAMKHQKYQSVLSLAEYLQQCPEDFCDVSPLEYTSQNWIRTSIEIDNAVSNRSYKTLDTCKQVLQQVNRVLLQNEEFYLQLVRLEMMTSEASQDGCNIELSQ
jgi:hypothetical protein